MNLKPPRPSDGPKGTGTPIKGSVLTVWTYLRSVAFITSPPTTRFQVSRREIQNGTRIGSLNTIDSALEDLEAYGLMSRHSAPGSNDGQIYELLSLDEKPVPVLNRWSIAATLRRAADHLECNSITLDPEQLSKWFKIVHQAQKLVAHLK
jgi:hypothetical protein